MWKNTGTIYWLLFLPVKHQEIDSSDGNALLTVMKEYSRYIEAVYSVCISLQNGRLFILNRLLLKGELNVDKKWQSDYLFYIIMNEIRPCVDQF